MTPQQLEARLHKFDAAFPMHRMRACMDMIVNDDELIVELIRDMRHKGEIFLVGYCLALFHQEEANETKHDQTTETST